MDLGTAFTVVLAVTTVLSAAITGALVGRNQAKDKDFERQIKTSDELRKRISDLEDERAKDKTEIAELRALYEAAKQIATGEVQWQIVVELLTTHQKDAKEHWTKELDLLSVLLRAEAHWAREIELLEEIVGRWDTFAGEET